MREFYRAHQPSDLIKPKKAEDLEQVATAAGFDVRDYVAYSEAVVFWASVSGHGQHSNVLDLIHPRIGMQALAPMHPQPSKSDPTVISIPPTLATRSVSGRAHEEDEHNRNQKLVIESHVIARMIVHVAAYQGVYALTWVGIVNAMKRPASLSLGIGPKQKQSRRTLFPQPTDPAPNHRTLLLLSVSPSREMIKRRFYRQEHGGGGVASSDSSSSSDSDEDLEAQEEEDAEAIGGSKDDDDDDGEEEEEEEEREKRQEHPHHSPSSGSNLVPCPSCNLYPLR
ncbi:hypothetical protein GW17_00022759 [Ensete ventricosum]|nr:hypothetical protein GW17_00022759 [Ensete ventricosum]